MRDQIVRTRGRRKKEIGPHILRTKNENCAERDSSNKAIMPKASRKKAEEEGMKDPSVDGIRITKCCRERSELKDRRSLTRKGLRARNIVFTSKKVMCGRQESPIHPTSGGPQKDKADASPTRVTR